MSEIKKVQLRDAIGSMPHGWEAPPPASTLFRSSSTPNGQPRDSVTQIPPRLPRSLSAEALFRPHAMDTKEMHALVQELGYHTNSSHKQLQELCQRLNCLDDYGEVMPSAASQHASPVLEASAPPSYPLSSTMELPEANPWTPPARQTSEAIAEEEDSPADSAGGLAAVLAEFGLSASPDALRTQLRDRLRPKVRRLGSRSYTPQSLDYATPEIARTTSASSSRSRLSPAPGTPGVLPPSLSARRENGIDLRSLVRLQISDFLKDPSTRVHVLSRWKNEAQSLQAVQQNGNWLNTQSYRRLYQAFMAMFSNARDENDSPIRKVLFDLMAGEAKRSAWVCPKDDRRAMPPQAEGTRRAVQCFRDVVLKVRASPSENWPPHFESSQWEDCLSRLHSQFEKAFEETFRRAWPQAEMAFGVIPDEDGSPVVSPLQSLKRTLAQNADNADLLCAACRSIASSADMLDREMSRDPEQFWNTYLRQAINVSKQFLELARETTLLTGLWTLGHGLEGEHLSNTVLRREYRRVRRGFADLLLQKQREILEAWSEAIAKELPQDAAKSLDKHLKRKVLGAVIDWWRTGHSGMLRTACIDVVAKYNEKIDAKGTLPASDTTSNGGVEVSTQLEQILAVVPLFKDIALAVLRRQVAVQDGPLSAVDEPRVLDILSRLTHELSEHLDSEWHIALAQRAGGDVLPPSRIFQAPHWKNGEFDFEAVKTEFLGTRIQDRYVVTRYVNRGAMGRVWAVEELQHSEDFPLCLKTFFCEHECQELSRLHRRVYTQTVLEELSQVERWMLNRTRLSQSRHLVRVVKVFRNTPVVRRGCKESEGCINGILMEFCNQGELTSYLCDSKQNPEPFDEPTAQFFFAQLTELLGELCPAMTRTFSYSSEDLDGSLGLQVAENASPLLSTTMPSPTSPNKLKQSLKQFTAAAASFADLNGVPEDAEPCRIDTMFEDHPVTAHSIQGTNPSELQGQWESFKAVQDEGGSPKRMLNVSLISPSLEHGMPIMSPALEPLMRDKVKPLKYFHNDIKTENLVLSGTTLKLIDFQSLTPLRQSKMSKSPEHATPVYRHRQPKALPDSIEARAEGTMVWACGVILVGLLAPKLDAPSWVYHHRGLGTQEDLEKELEMEDDENCLLCPPQDHGPRDLLEKIFSPEKTPTIVEVLTHPWVDEARRRYKNGASEDVEAKLLKRRPQESYEEWIQLTSCVLIHGQPAPLQTIKDIVDIAISLSDGRFCLLDPDGHEIHLQEESFHEWNISMCVDGIDEENEGSGNEAEEETNNLPGGPEDPQFDPSPQPTIRHRLSTASNVSLSGDLYHRPSLSSQYSGSNLGAMSRRLSMPLSNWARARKGMFMDRFDVQVREKKDNPTEDDLQNDVWWLCVKWRPPMVGRAKSESVGMFKTRRFVQSDNFTLLQQLLLDGRNEVVQRKERAEEEQRKLAQASKPKPAKPAGPMLPIFGR